MSRFYRFGQMVGTMVVWIITWRLPNISAHLWSTVEPLVGKKLNHLRAPVSHTGPRRGFSLSRWFAQISCNEGRDTALRRRVKGQAFRSDHVYAIISQRTLAQAEANVLADRSVVNHIVHEASYRSFS
jgi:hypothetical protein